MKNTEMPQNGVKIPVKNQCFNSRFALNSHFSLVVCGMIVNFVRRMPDHSARVCMAKEKKKITQLKLKMFPCPLPLLSDCSL